MAIETTRRAVLAGAAASIPATALAALPATASPIGPDPIFAAIEAHRAAYLKQAASSRVQCLTSYHSPDYADIDAVADADCADFRDAALDLLDTMPTTTAGMLALLAHVDSFNRGGLALDPLPEDKRSAWASEAHFWPKLEDDAEYPFDGAECGAAFAWALLNNVAAFLKTQVVGS